MCEKCENCAGVLSPVLSSDFACRGNAGGRSLYDAAYENDERPRLA
jgi:hypothetical protein